MKKITYILIFLFTGILSAQTIGEGSSTLTGSAGDITGAASTIVTADLANNRALISNGSGKVAVSAVTTTELSYVSGVTSALQAQLDAKLPTASYTAADVLTKLLTVDGSGSGLDADLLDGVEGATYARKDQNNNFTTAQSITGNLTATGTGDFGGEILRVSGGAPRLRLSETGAANDWAIIADGNNLTFRENHTSNTRLTIATGGNSVFTGTVTATQYLLSALNTAPASAGATGTAGEIRIDANYIYICTATNTWKRVAISTW